MIAAAIGLAIMTPAFAQDTTILRLHQFLPSSSVVARDILKPWADRVTAASDGTLAFQHFDAMALGGRPGDLMDQAVDGVADITMTLAGYTPGRFPRTEVFELPFLMTDPEATARALWTMVADDFQDSEYSDVKVLGAWVHGPGIIHSADPIRSLDDMTGRTMRAPTAVVNDLLGELGATPVGMPLPSIPESLSKGVINGTVIPWEVTPSIRLAELVKNHTEFSGDEALYTAVLVLVMNKEAYAALPDAARAAIDAESGEALSALASRTMQEGDATGRAVAADAGNRIVTLDAAEVARWKSASQPVIARWIAARAEEGIDGQALIDRAKALIAEKGGS